MKTGFLVMAMATALLAAAMTGNVPAGDRMANNADPESALGQTWMSQGAIDTGKLPDAPGGASEGSRMNSGSTEFPLVDAGGVRYRVGIDTGP